jgi:hypothetical protein
MLRSEVQVDLTGNVYDGDEIIVSVEVHVGYGEGKIKDRGNNLVIACGLLEELLAKFKEMRENDPQRPFFEPTPEEFDNALEAFDPHWFDGYVRALDGLPMQDPWDPSACHVIPDDFVEKAKETGPKGPPSQQEYDEAYSLFEGFVEGSARRKARDTEFLKAAFEREWEEGYELSLDDFVDAKFSMYETPLKPHTEVQPTEACEPTDEEYNSALARWFGFLAGRDESDRMVDEALLRR